jgi:hypothetical protein
VCCCSLGLAMLIVFFMGKLGTDGRSPVFLNIRNEDKVVPVSGAEFGLSIRILGEKLGYVPSVPDFVRPLLTFPFL